jgi:hypothetical protein
MVALGISTNSKVLGLAIINSDHLIDCKVQWHKNPWSDMKGERIIASLHSCIKEHSIKNVALTIPHAHHITPQTQALINKIKAHCRKKKIRLSVYHPQAFHSLCEKSKAKKKALMKAMVIRYPELATYHQKELKNRNRYYHKLFESIGAATLLIREHY